MGSFIRAVLRLVINRRPQEGRIDEEQATGNGPSAAIPDPTLAPPTATATAATATTETTAPITTAPAARRDTNVLPHSRSYRVPEEDPLTLFRLMVGISTSPYLGYSESSPVGTRPAPNIGIYARVVSSEQKAKDSFKVYSVVINACYFLQIVVAASLTAMGAAGVNNGAITAFGAINTIIAGFLTFLKGSGLPSRLKYYGNEWKKIREFIEQRERDFSRTGCTLDVHEVVAAIDLMYNNTKREIEMNTPDSYTSVMGNVRQQHFGNDDKIAGVDVSKLEGLATRLKGLDERIVSGVESRVRGAAHRLHETEKEIEEEITKLEKAVARDVEDHAARLEREARERRAQAARAIDNEIEEVKQAGQKVAKDLSDTTRAAVDEIRTATSTQVHNIADKLSHLHDPRRES